MAQDQAPGSTTGHVSLETRLTVSVAAFNNIVHTEARRILVVLSRADEPLTVVDVEEQARMVLTRRRTLTMWLLALQDMRLIAMSTGSDGVTHATATPLGRKVAHLF